MKKEMSYESPEVEVIEVEVEHGFAVSDPNGDFGGTGEGFGPGGVF